MQATYKLEGDGPLVFECYEIISALSPSIVMENYPNVQAVIRNIAKSSEQKLKWMKYARQCIKPALDYYKTFIGGYNEHTFKSIQGCKAF